MSPNFGFLAFHDPELARLGEDAERFFARDPDVTLLRLRQLSEFLAKRAAAEAGMYASTAESQVDLLRRLADRQIVRPDIARIFHGLRSAGNVSAHEARGGHGDALLALKYARELSVWFHRTFGKDRAWRPGPFVPPPDPALAKTREESAGKAAATVREELARLREAYEKERSASEAARAEAEALALAKLGAEERAEREAQDHAAAMALAEESEARANKLAEERAELEAKLALLANEKRAAPPDIDAILARAHAAEAEIELDEHATRALIDKELRAVGWEADSAELTHASGARPAKGKNQAIAEWPTSNGPADYVLFAGLVPLAVVEAKRANKNVSSFIEQAKRYSRGFQFDDIAKPGAGPWGNFKIPFLFSTNGRPYFRQLREMSGTWFLDARKKENHADALDGWYTPGGLLELLERDPSKADAALRADPIESLDFLRDYQRRAVLAVEEAIAKGARTALVAMATGTGKTKTTIALVYRLLKNKRFRRVLFLVDRSALGEQAGAALEETKLERLQSLPELYDVKELGAIEPTAETRLHIATIQSMVRRLFDDAPDERRPPVDRYDCIIVDECHRGYLLDREMSDAELSYRDEDDYVSMYRRVLDHFDAVKIGLTATPALHTTEIFGRPVFEYDFRTAVVEGVLIGPDPPIQIVTKLSKEGIAYAAGAEVMRVSSATKGIERATLPDEQRFDVESFNRRIITEDTTRVVCAELAKKIDPTSAEKTIVFCVDDAHADRVVIALKKAFDEVLGGVEDDAVKKITGESDKPRQLIKEFKNERLPNVAVTVDLLTTGIDVPAVANIVFLRCVRSRILYEQMLGRATRRCDPIKKERFRIFDAVDLYARLESVSNMRPVVVNPATSFVELEEALRGTKRADALREIADQIVAKLQAKKRRVTGAWLDAFVAAAGEEPEAVATLLAKSSPEDVRAFLLAHPGVTTVLDHARAPNEGPILSEHRDELREVTHGFPYGKKPGDYLADFAAFLRDHLNEIPALLVVTQRPRDLTRKDLKALKLALDQAGYPERSLRTAWREMTNEDVAASIVGHVRKAAVGDPLVPYAERVEHAKRKLLASKSWNEAQRRWLEKIAEQLKVETVVDRPAFDDGVFKIDGGYTRANRVFEGKLDEVLGDLHAEVWKAG